MYFWHLTIAAAQRRHAFHDRARRLASVHALLRIAAPVLLLWCIVDDHLHLVIAGTRPEAGRLAQRLHLALAAIMPDAEFEAARIRPVEDRHHLVTLVPYVLAQTRKHDLPFHPARWDGSCFQDLVGARRLCHFDARPLAQALPRLTRDQILAAVDAPPWSLRPVDDDRVRATAPAALAEAAAAAVGLPRLQGRTEAAVEARCVVLHLARRAEWPVSHLAPLLRVHPGSARRLVARAPDPKLEDAVRRQIALRAAVPEQRRPPLAAA